MCYLRNFIFVGLLGKTQIFYTQLNLSKNFSKCVNLLPYIWMVQIECYRELIRQKINEKNKHLQWSYYEQKTIDEQIECIDTMKTYEKGQVCNLISSIIILGLFIVGYVIQGKEFTIFQQDLQIFVVLANFQTIVESKLSIKYHNDVIRKGDLNSNGVYIAKVIYGSVIMFLKVNF